MKIILKNIKTELLERSLYSFTFYVNKALTEEHWVDSLWLVKGGAELSWFYNATFANRKINHYSVYLLGISSDIATAYAPIRGQTNIPLTRCTRKRLDSLEEVVETYAVLLDEGKVLELLGTKETQLVSTDSTQRLKVHRVEGKFLDCPLCPTVHLLLGPLAGVWRREGLI